MKELSEIMQIFFGQLEEKENVIKSFPEAFNLEKHKKGILNLLENKVSGYKVNDEIKQVLSLLFNYFTGNVEYCQSENISLNKGIFIIGGVGVGKSIIMQAFKEYTQLIRINSFQYTEAKNIIDVCNINGVVSLERFCFLYDSPITLYIDDIASKNETVSNYGTKINVIEQLISSRYEIFQRFRKLTHFSSNIYPSEMAKIYDLRIIDRLSEMCNIIELKGNSFRK